MIGYLRGILLEKELPNLILDVSGIGYEIQMPVNSFTQLPPIGQEVSLYIHCTKREDGDFLYGFMHKEQKSLFRSLIRISNIGPKIALAILSAMDPNTFAEHLASNNVMALESISGIGAKTAKRLLIEMKDKVAELGLSQLNANSPIATAISALITLGYKPGEARQALDRLKDKNLSSEELIRLALKEIR